MLEVTAIVNKISYETLTIVVPKRMVDTVPEIFIASHDEIFNVLERDMIFPKDTW